MTRCRVENLSDRPQILHRHFFYINTEFETGGAGIWKKKLNLGTPNDYLKSIGSKVAGKFSREQKLVDLVASPTSPKIEDVQSIQLQVQGKDG